jgi:hypothetical protein
MDKIPAALQRKIYHIKHIENLRAMIDKERIIFTSSNDDKPIGSANVKFKGRNKPDQHAYQLSCCLWVGAFVLCGGIGLVLGAAFGGSL